MAIAQGRDPFDLFGEWYAGAEDCGLKEPTAVMLATADEAGRPSARMVLLKGYDESGFVFYTNLESRKGRQLSVNPYAALCFHWMPLGRQIRIEGPVSPVSEQEADAYFASRPKDSQIGAWASKQSSPLQGMLALEKRVAKYALKYGIGKVPRPDFWSGFRLAPERIEFWQHRASRLHERLQYERVPGGSNGWETERLFP
ncbi:MAG: pyridoxamine 5'-phosphate oxidase [Rhodospirillaceae bacterium]|nr:pyridoxamine 5'-phosphate oxidase [Rhodospirillaceae bacterium]MBT6829196.1 pyridoxamine 5'-phosphate oxidase [Rhodospirillaceae bacterium]